MPKLNVLITDDDEADCREIGRVISKVYRNCCLQTSGGWDVTESIQGASPDIVFIDYGLPELDGIELMEILKSGWPETPFIIMTGQGDEEIARDSIVRGAIDYLPKVKISVSSIRRIVGNALAMTEMKKRLKGQQKELEIFADVMVHDLKSPVRSIGFLVDELKLHLENDDAAEVDNVMRLLKISTVRMGELVDSLACHALTTKEIAFEKASLYGTIKTAMHALERVIADSNAKVHCCFDDVTLRCCPPQLSQLFQNVFANSIKYAGDKPPEVKVTTASCSANHIELHISDNGIGIPAEFRDRAFEPFKRAPRSTSVAGTGLGLATCRKVAMRHGGRIWCDPDVVAGTTIVLYLPLNPDSAAVLVPRK